MIKHNSYFDGAVQSLGFERFGKKATIGVIHPGSYHFGTDAPERMIVVSGELKVKLDSTEQWTTYPAGTYFEVPGKSGFDVSAEQPCAYCCEY